MKELYTNAPDDQKSNRVSSTIGSSGRISSCDSLLQQPSLTCQLTLSEHRRLLGYKGRRRPNRQKVFANSKRVQTWTRQFVCSPKSDQIKPPKLWDYSLLQAAAADRKISLEIWGQQSSKWVYMKLTEAYPSWKTKGLQPGCLVRTAKQGYRCLTVIKGPNTTETVEDFRGQEKIFVRSLQQDLVWMKL